MVNDVEVLFCRFVIVQFDYTKTCCYKPITQYQYHSQNPPSRQVQLLLPQYKHPNPLIAPVKSLRFIVLAIQERLTDPTLPI